MKYSNPFPFFALGLLCVLAVVFLLFGGSLGQTYVSGTQELSVAQVKIIEVVSGHSWSQHGADVNLAFNCLKRNGTAKAFKTFGFADKGGKFIPTNLWMCFDGNDWYSVVTTVFERVGADKTARLVTAYKVTKELFPTVDEYITYIAERWNAFEINYSIRPGEIFLNPR